jgi:hypothetical protein
MATVTPNFNWPVPTSTDLVKDGATAIEALGDSIDASLVDLKGGTSGQVLSKNSNTDMDFVWVTSDDANAIQNTIVDAKGDLITATAADTPARLAVGANGETLVADSSTSTGLRYQGNFAAGKNKMLNGDFGVWQRGTSFTVASGVATYTADRYGFNRDGSGVVTVSRQAFTPGTAPVAGYEGSYYLRFNQSTAGSGGTYSGLYTRLEDVQTFAGQTLTLSFWAKADATRNISLSLQQNFGSGGSGSVDVTSSSIALSTSWTRYTYTVTLASISGKTIGTSSYLQLFINLPGNTAQTIEFWGFQMEAGSVATAFQTATGTIQGELAACQRYYEKTYAIGTAAGTNTSVGLFINYGSSESIGNTVVTIPMQVAKRNVSYSVAVYTSSGTANSWSYARSGAAADTTMTIDLKSERTFRAYGAVGANWVVATINGHWVVDNEL